MPPTTQKPVSIVADSREQQSTGICQALGRFPGVSLERREMDCGDYLLSPRMAVERKSAGDLLASIFDGRLFEQAAKLVLAYPKAVLLIEGDPYQTRSAISLEAIDGALSWLSTMSGLQVISSPSVARTPWLLWRMCLHEVHGLGYEIPLRVGKPKNQGLMGQFILEGLPGVGPTLAQKILHHFGSAGAALAAAEQDLQRVPGLGPKTAQGIIAALATGPMGSVQT